MPFVKDNFTQFINGSITIMENFTESFITNAIIVFEKNEVKGGIKGALTVVSKTVSNLGDNKLAQNIMDTANNFDF